jgi:subtilisin
MKKLLIAAMVILVLASVPVGRTQANSSESRTYLLVFREDQNPEGVAKGLQQQYGFQLRGIYRYALKGAVIAASREQVSGLEKDERVVLIEQNRVYSIAQVGQTVPTGIQRAFADENQFVDIDSDDDVRIDADVAVLDTGIDFDHPDLNLAMAIDCTWSGPNEGTCAGTRDDGNGHGTHVAGTIGALDNGLGVVGVAPGVRLWAVKVLTNLGSGTTAQIVAGIDWVAARASEIEVANMSLGGIHESAVMDLAISGAVEAGVTFALAAGNSATDVADYHPAGHPDAITVSALADFDGLPGGLAAPTCVDDVDDTRAYFSNYGAGVTIAAPGTCIYSTTMNGLYATKSGTSMAAPHAAGAAAILASTGLYSTPAQIKSVLVAAGNYDWIDDSGDGIQEPLLDLSNEALFNPTVLVTAAQIPLTAVGYAVSGWQRTDLSWDYPESTIDVYRDGMPVAWGITSPYTDVVGERGAGMHFYRVCGSGGQIMCSAPVIVTY